MNFAVTLPVAHNGQIFHLVPNENTFSGTYNVFLRRDVDVFAGNDWVIETVEERLGSVQVNGDDVDGVRYLEAWTRWNIVSTKWAHDLTEALAFVVDNYRGCAHPSGSGIERGEDDEFSTLYECDDCAATYYVTDDGEIVTNEYAHPHA